MEEDQHQIRHAYLEEYEGASLVASQAYQCLKAIYPPGLWPSVQKMISDAAQLKGGGELLIAITHEGISGLVVYHAPSSYKSEHLPQSWASLAVLAVLPQYRRRGIGSKLIQTCLNIAKTDKTEVFGVLLNVQMTAAKTVFEGKGFVKNGYSRMISGQKHDQYCLTL